MSLLPATKPVLLSVALALLGAIGLFALLGLQHGAIDTSFSEVLQLLLFDDGSNKAFSLHQIRLPRVLNALFVGAGLALSGTLIQVIIRNPLGDPGLTGVSAGAALGVAVAITLLGTAASLVLLAGVLGGALAAVVTFLLARRSGFADISVILAGIAVSVFFLAATSMLMILNNASMQTLYYWMIGGFANKGWLEFGHLWPVLALSAALALWAAPVLELLRMEDKVAAGLGVNTGLWRLFGAAVSVLLAAAAVSVAGPIGFIGFIAPHLVRGLLSRWGQQLSVAQLLPLAALCGGALTLLADYGARALPLGNRAPAGVLITVFGGIGFLLIAARLDRGGEDGPA